MSLNTHKPCKMKGEKAMNDEQKWDIISSYTRAQAIADGVLVDVTETAKEAGFRIPVALTHAAWAEYVSVPEGVEGQDEKGRLWDVLWMCRYGIGRGNRRDQAEILFRLHVRNDN